MRFNNLQNGKQNKATEYTIFIQKGCDQTLKDSTQLDKIVFNFPQFGHKWKHFKR